MAVQLPNFMTYLQKVNYIVITNTEKAELTLQFCA